MKKKFRLLYVAGVALLLGVYFVPIWSIELEAPQFPEGLGFYIWVNKITGFNENDLNSINGLNHYIGMKKIEPDSIAELKLMPLIIGGCVLLGLLAAAVNKRAVYWGWVAVLIGLLAAGMVDFYLWEYDYGHNLDPRAAIKIPGAAFQPPLIGVKNLLNFRAISLPHFGAVLIFLSLLIALYSLFISKSPKT